MSRFIDADEFKKYISDAFEENKHLFNDEYRQLVKAVTDGFLADIDEQPTAYDIDKVVEQLEEGKHMAACCAFGHSCTRSFPKIISEQHYGRFEGYEKAIEIVKKGGAE